MTDSVQTPRTEPVRHRDDRLRRALFRFSQSKLSMIGAAIVVVYCFSGGLRASIWTDAAQALVMLVALGLLLGHAVAEVGHRGAPPWTRLFPPPIVEQTKFYSLEGRLAATTTTRNP